MGIFDTLGLSSSSADARAAQQRKQALAIGKKTTAAQSADVKKGYAKAGKALAPALTNIGDIYAQEQVGRNAYMDALNLTPGGTERTLDRFNYSPMTMDLLRQQEQGTLRNAASGGYLRSGETPVELQKQAYLNLAPEWNTYLNRLGGFNPLEANAQNLSGRTTLGGWDIGQGTALSGIAGSQGQNQLAANQGYFDAVNQNQANVAGNFGTLASGLLGAGTKLFGMYGPQPNLGTGWNTSTSYG